MKKTTFIILVLIFSLNLMSTLINVPDAGSGIFDIQSGIEISVDGDTVLVAPGIYYENINFIGKKITIASEFIFSGDDDDIEGTIIDGGGVDTVVRMESGEDTLSYLCGFVIRNGNYYRGGGISIYQSGAKFEHLKIRNNIAESPNLPHGGGLFADGDSWLPGYRQIILRNVEITDNIARGDYPSGGGFTLKNRIDLIIFENVLVSDNLVDGYTACCSGGGEISEADNISLKNCFISNNLATAPQSGSVGGIGMNDIIDASIEDCQIIGNTVDTGYSRCGGMGISGSGDITIKNCLIADNSSIAGGPWGDEAGGGGMSLSRGNFIVEDCEVRGNVASDGCGGLGISLDCNAVLNRLLIHDNVSAEGAALMTGDVDCLLINSIVYNNPSTFNGGMSSLYDSRIRIVNSIFWNNGGSNFLLNEPLDLQIYHSIIEDGEGSIECLNGADYFWGEGNLDGDPMFVNAGGDDFHLLTGSPGIDSGVNACLLWGDEAYFVPEEDIIGKNRDIGIFETGDEDYYFDLPTYLSVDEDNILNFDLEDYMMGMEGQISGSCENNLTSMVVGNVISWQPFENWFGFDEVWVNFETTGGETFSDFILIEVMAVNDAPIIELPDMVSFNNIGHHLMDVLQYISDIEGQTVMVSASGSEHITAEIQNPNPLLEGEPGWQGIETITIYAEDEWQRLLSSDTMLVEVYCLPIADCGEDIFCRDGETATLDGSLSIDPLLNGLSYFWNTEAEIEIDNAESMLAIAHLPETEEMVEAVINLEVSDGFNSSTDSMLLEFWDDEPVDVECDMYPASSLIRINWSPGPAAESEHFELLGYQMYFEGCEYDTLQNTTDCVYMYVLPEGEYELGVQAVYSDGASGIVNVSTTDADINDISGVTGIISVYPNPFNPETTISFFTTTSLRGTTTWQAEVTEITELSIYNLKGQKIKTLENGILPAGRHSVVWKGNDDSGHRVGSGMYFIKLKVGDEVFTNKVVLIK
ncbi:MAG: right-handed parallel beta-helix repeat-containing protein [Candidatus Cloacimonetes bacterium]|nr:right-handed parallel beta-helix repeat-containing protein [Candidatus Cloacimonadota bacterium]